MDDLALLNSLLDHTIGFSVLYIDGGVAGEKTFWVEPGYDAEAEAEQFGGAMDEYVIVPVSDIVIVSG